MRPAGSTTKPTFPDTDVSPPMPHDSTLSEWSLPSVAPRQIAILLGSLPERTHGVLLGQLAKEERQRVEEELTVLTDVDAMERYRVLKLMYEQLHAETESVEKVESEIQDEIQIGRARVAKKRSAAIYRQAEPPKPTRTDAAPVHESSTATATASAAEVATPAETTPDDRGRSPDRRPDAAPARDEDQLRAQFQQTQAAGVLPLKPFPRLHPDSVSQSAEASGIAFAEEIPTVAAHADAEGHASTPWSHDPQPVCEADELAERVDSFLNQLPPQQLCQALGMVSTKEAFLVLCGLPNETAEEILGMLPRRQSRKVRHDMRRMGRLQLCEIDQAKQAVAEIALRLTSRREALAA